MGKHNVYLRRDHEMQLEREAERARIPLRTLLGKKLVDALESPTEAQKMDDILMRVSRLESTAGALFSLLEIVANELAHVVGVTRVSTQSDTNLVRAGTAQEAAMARSIESIRKAMRAPSEPSPDAESEDN